MVVDQNSIKLVGGLKGVGKTSMEGKDEGQKPLISKQKTDI